MAIPIKYNVRNMVLRKGLTIMTALGIALTVTTAVFIMALLAGLQKAFQSTGNPLNVLVLRKGSTSERTVPPGEFSNSQDSARYCQGQER
jgi:putative ABC transport system permease protein